MEDQFMPEKSRRYPNVYRLHPSSRYPKVVVWSNFCRTLSHILHGLPLCTMAITSSISVFIWLNNVKNCKFLIYASMFLVMKINKKSCNPLPFKCWRIIRMVPCNSCPVCLSDNLIRFIGLNNVRIFSIAQSWEGIFPSCKLSVKNN